MANKKVIGTKCWINIGKLGERTFFETKKRSKIYKGQPSKEISVRIHPLDKKKWTAEFGQAAISMPKFKTEREAMVEAMDYMKRNDGC